MRPIHYRLTAIALCLGLCLLSSCQKSESPNAPEQSVPAATGRYLEEELSAPQGLEYFCDVMQDENGEIRLLGTKRTENGSPYYCFRSMDGKNWTDEPVVGLDELPEELIIDTLSFHPGGGYYALGSTYPPEFFTLMDTDPKAAYAMQPTNSLHLLSEDGVLTPQDFIPPNDISGASPNLIRPAPNGDYLVGVYFGLLQVDGATGEVKGTYEVGDGFEVNSGSFAAFGNTLAMCETAGVSLYDLATGEKLRTISVSPAEGSPAGAVQVHDVREGAPSGYRAVTFSETQEALYFCDSTGIYRALCDGTAVERLADGSLNSLGMPSIRPIALFLRPDGGLLAACINGDGAITLLSYRYDDTVLSVPSTELRLYSLHDSKTLRQAAGLFQRENPDVYVNYAVGMSGSDGVTAPDAIRALSTQLLAGDGPDVLAMDDLPIDSYISKGALLPLDGLMEPGELFQNVEAAFLRDGGTYALPARFSVPMINASDEAVEAVHGPQDLYDYLSGQKNVRLQFRSPSILISDFYPLCAGGWFDESGGLSEEALSKDLQAIQKLSSLPGVYIDEGERKDPSCFQFGALFLKQGVCPVNFGTLYSVEGMGAPLSVIRELGGGQAAPFSGENGPVYTPVCILGANSGGKQQELAKKFIRFALSEQVLKNRFDEGLPANLKAFEENTGSIWGESGAHYGLSYHADGEEQYLTARLHWPEKEEWDLFREQLCAIKTAAPSDAVLRQMVIDETAGYFDGSRSLAETMDALGRKVKLYLAEQ